MYLTRVRIRHPLQDADFFEKKGVVFMGTIITLVVVAGLVGLAVRSIIKDKKSGKGSCGGNCGQCKRHCD